jgi:hypothetical protein
LRIDATDLLNHGPNCLDDESRLIQLDHVATRLRYNLRPSRRQARQFALALAYQAVASVARTFVRPGNVSRIGFKPK